MSIKRILSFLIYDSATVAMILALMQPAFSQGSCCGSCSYGCTLYGVGGTNFDLCLCAVTGEACKPVE